MPFKFFRRHEPEAAPPPAQAVIAAPIAEPAAPAPVDGFLTYALQLDAQRHIKGYKFEWRAASGSTHASDDFRALLSTVASNLNGVKAGWRLGKLDDLRLYTQAGSRVTALVARDRQLLRLALQLPAQKLPSKRTTKAQAAPNTEAPANVKLAVKDVAVAAGWLAAQ